MKKVLFALFVFASFINLNAQQRSCNSQDVLERQIKENPDRAVQLELIESQLDRYMEENQNSVGQRTVVTIPVVFHVVYKTAAQNISDAQLQSQLDVLNEDFRRLNSDANNQWSQAADVEVEFCLATVDPAGNPTTGITRTQTTRNVFTDDDKVKKTNQGGHDAWPASDYMNFWVCNLDGFLGYAQFPGGPAATDGVVCAYQYTGRGGSAAAPFDLGRTGTHEVGHWLNLYHIWGDGGCGVDDNVSDTPASDAPNYGCASNHQSCGSLDMVANYMDYSDDGCMNLFTQGQKTRMQALFASGGARASLLNSTGCGSTPPPPACDVPTGLNVTGIAATSADANWTSVSGANDYEVSFREVGSSWAVAGTTSNTTLTITGLSDCKNYEVRVKSNCASGSSANSSSVAFTTTGTCPPPPPATCDVPTGGNVSSITNNGATFSWDAMAGAIKYKVIFRIGTSGPWTSAGFVTTNTITLPNLNSCTNYQIRVRTHCSATSRSSYTSPLPFTTIGCTPVGCQDNYEPNNSRGSSALINRNSTINAKISSITDEDWFKVTSTNSNPNIKVNLTNLPDDYDLELYRGSNLVDYSENPGTLDEQVQYNFHKKRKYFIHVYGWAGANSSDCYDLTNTISSTPFRTSGHKIEKVSKKDRSNLNLDAINFTASPNPATDEVTLRFIKSKETSVNLSLTDATGKQVYSETILLNEGTSNVTLPLENVSAGMFFIRATDGTNSHTERLIIQKL